MALEDMEWFDWLAIVLLIVGGINWGFIGFFGINLVGYLSFIPYLGMIIYDLVGLAAVFSIIRFIIWK